MHSALTQPQRQVDAAQVTRLAQLRARSARTLLNASAVTTVVVALLAWVLSQPRGLGFVLALVCSGAAMTCYGVGCFWLWRGAQLGLLTGAPLGDRYLLRQRSRCVQHALMALLAECHAASAAILLYVVFR